MKRNLRMRICALILALCMLPVANVFAAGYTYDAVNDGYTYGEKQEVLVFDASNLKLAKDAKFSGIVALKGATDGKAACWGNISTQLSVPVKTQRNWSKLHVMNFRIYSEEASNDTIQIRPSTHANRVRPSDNFFHYTISIDWTGWKDFSVSIPDAFNVNNFPDISDISSVNIIKYGSNSQGVVSMLYFDDIYLTSYIREEADVRTILPTDAYSEGKAEEAEKELESGVAFYVFASSVINGGEIAKLDDENTELAPVFSDSYAMVPISFFEKHLGCSIAEADGVYTVKNKTAEAKLQLGDTACRVNGTEKRFSVAPMTEKSATYVEAIALARMLGFSAEGYNENRLTVIGKKDLIEKFNNDQELVSAASYEIAGNYDPSQFTDADFEAAKDAWRVRYCGSEKINDLTDPNKKKKIETITDSALKRQNAMNGGDDPPALWGTELGTTSYVVEGTYINIYEMALAYGTYGSTLYKDERLGKDIIRALDWAYNHVYGQQQINGKGFRSIYLADWYHWMVGGPQYLLATLLIMDESISDADIQRYLEPYHFIRSHSRTGAGKAFASSRMECGTLAAILEKDRTTLKQRWDDFNLSLEVTKSGDCFLEDYNYSTHGIPYVVAYGLNNLERTLEVMGILEDTPLAFPSPRLYNQMKFLELGYRPVMYNGRAMAAFAGRDMQRGTEFSNSNRIILGLLPLLGVFGEQEDAEIKAFMKNAAMGVDLTRLKSDANLYQYDKLMSVLNENAEEAGDYEIGHVYYTGDILVQQRNNYAFALRMYSTRIGNYESCDGENGMGWYTGDGALYFYTDHDKKSFDGSNFLSNEFVAYAIPGTTEDVQPRIDWNNAGKWTSSKNFVGGNEYEKKYITAAFDYEAFHNDTEPTGDDSGYGGQYVYKKCTLTAKKSYFFFDDEVVCLGADVNANDDSQVNTYIETRRLIKTAFGGIDADEEPHTIVNITATGDDGNVPENVYDDDYSTRWSYQGTENAYLTMELDDIRELGYISIAQYGGASGNKAVFDIEVSNDGKNWTQVFSGMASGETEAPENFNLGGVQAKFVRYSGHGRISSDWNSITEIKLYPGEMPDPEEYDVDAEEIIGAEDVIVDGELLEKKAYVKEFTNPAFFAIEGYGGYWLPSGGNLVIEKTNRKPNAFIKAYLNHGVNPQNDKYEYVICPYKTAEEMRTYSTNPDIEILANNSKVQAVREKNLKLTGIIFWEAGTFEEITVSEPCIVMYGEEDGKKILTVCDPTQKLTEIEIGISEKVSLDDDFSDNNFKTVSKDGVLKLKVSVIDSIGKTYKAVLK